MLAATLAGLTAGLIHVLSGPDHLAAVAPLAGGRRRAWHAGFLWGLGHSGGVLAVGLLTLALRGALPIDALSSWSERIVGVTPIGQQQAAAPQRRRARPWPVERGPLVPQTFCECLRFVATSERDQHLDRIRDAGDDPGLRRAERVEILDHGFETADRGDMVRQRQIEEAEHPPVAIRIE